MKKIKITPKSLLKALPGILIVGFYWYWVNQRIISDSGQTFDLIGFFILMSLATAYFPLPANIIVLGAVKTADPLVVAVVGGVATLIAFLSEYVVFTLLFKFNKVANFKNTWVYQKVAPLFDKHRFFILAFTSFLPIPAEALRVYAITRKYPVVLFMLSGFAGRIPRYYLLGYYGKEYVGSIWFLAAVFLFPGVLLPAIRGGMALYKLLNARFSWRPKQPESVALAATASQVDDSDLQ